MKSISSITGVPQLKLPTSIATGVAAVCLMLGGTAHAQSSISGVYPNGATQFQPAAALTFTASSPLGVTTVSVQLTSTNIQTGASLARTLSLGNGLSTTGSSTSYAVSAPLSSNTVYGAVITVSDANSQSASTTVNFDTISPVYTFEAEDWDFTSNGVSGLYIPNPQTNQYAGLASTSGNDFLTTNPGSGGSPYRPQGLETETEGDVPRAAYVSTTNIDYDIGFNNGGNWADYTRNYPAGTYVVYLRGSGGNGPRTDAASLTKVAGTAVINGTGPFQYNVAGHGWQTYTWCPLIDSSSGTLATVTFDGTPSTLRVTIDQGNCNENFYMLLPLNTNIPVSIVTVTNLSPDGSMMYNTNGVFSFTAVSPTAPLNPANIFVQVTSTNLWGQGTITTLGAANGLTISGPSTNYTVSFPLNTNTIYSLQIQITDANGVSSLTSASFDTIVAPAVTPAPNTSYSFEAEDFNYSGGQYFDNPQTNAYYGLDGNSGVDYNLVAAMQNNEYLRAGLNTEKNGDSLRDAFNNTLNQFGVPNIDYDVGFTAGGQWGDYTRNYPAGTYNIYVRASDGGGSSTDSGSIALVTSDRTQSGQSITRLGTFSVPGTGGWQTYTWVPVLDAQGNLARFNGGSLETLRATTDNGNYNVNFYLLVPADPSVHPLPTVSNFAPDGTGLFQFTNQLSFTASSSAGLATTGIVVSVNGINITPSLSISGSSIAWNVTAPVKANGSYTAVVTLTDANGTSVSTNVFNTYNATNYQFEAEDYDYTSGSVDGLFFDNPQEGSYAGLTAASGVDILESDVNGPSRGNSYRPAGFANFPDTSAGDQARVQFTSSGKTDYSVGSFGPGSWANYTRNYPAGTYNVIGRFAEGAANTKATLSRLTSGYATPTQTTSFIGTFNIPLGGWSTWEYVPLLDNSGHLATVTLDGNRQTLQLGGSPNSSDPEANVNFFMLVPAAASPWITATTSGGNLHLSYLTQTGYSYQVQYKNNLTDPNWTSLGGVVTGDNLVHSASDSDTTGSRYYRVQVQ